MREVQMKRVPCRPFVIPAAWFRPPAPKHSAAVTHRRRRRTAAASASRGIPTAARRRCAPVNRVWWWWSARTICARPYRSDLLLRPPPGSRPQGRVCPTGPWALRSADEAAIGRVFAAL